MSYILVIGSAHIDAVAITDETLGDERPDLEGRVSFSLGGTAFNIAKNLAQHEKTVEFLTSLKKDSITAGLVENQCVKFGIRLRWPIYQNESEGGFAGHFFGTKIVKAICEAAIERVTAKQFDESLTGALRRASLVVVDTNLHSEQLGDVLRHSLRLGKDVIVAGVSVSRVQRLYRAVSSVSTGGGPLIGVLCINVAEAKALGVMKGDLAELLADPESSIDVTVLTALRVRRLVLSCGASGYYIFDPQEGSFNARHGAVNINPADIKSDNGAGDAMVAAIASVYRDGHKVWQDKIQEFVAPVLKVVSATTEDDLNMSRSISSGSQKMAWTALAVSVALVILLPVAGRMPQFHWITADDVVFLLTAALGLSAGIAGGKLRDMAAKIGLADQKQLVSAATSILSAAAGLFTLFSFFVLPRFVEHVPGEGMHAPTQVAAALWYCVALVGGYFTDLVARQRLQLKQLRELTGGRE